MKQSITSQEDCCSLDVKCPQRQCGRLGPQPVGLLGVVNLQGVGLVGDGQVSGSVPLEGTVRPVSSSLPHFSPGDELFCAATDLKQQGGEPK